MSFAIKTDVPLPKTGRGGRGRRSKYGFDTMTVGAALIFEPSDEGFYSSPRGLRVHRAVAAAHKFGVSRGWKFETRLLNDGGLGIWRVA